MGAAARQTMTARWVWACAVAEGIGMTAAAGAARLADDLQERGHGSALALTVVVAGGLVEGTGLGVLQARALRPLVGRSGGRWWALVTIAVAGVGWAAASAPSVVGSNGTAGNDTTPPLLLVLVGAMVLGGVMGAVLGAAQGTVLRRRTSKPWRWVWISALGWAAAMPVIFLGATLPSASTPVAVVLVVAAVTGLVAGTLLGCVTGVLLPSLSEPRVSNAVMLQLLASPAHRAVDRWLVGLRVTGTVTGRVVTLPVQYAADDAGLVLLPGHPERKRWWRNLRGGARVSLLVARRWVPAYGRVLLPGDPAYAAAARTCRRRWPHVGLPEGQPLVRIEALNRPTAATRSSSR